MDSAHIPLALTYDDVLLVPQRSRITSRKMVDTAGHVTPKIRLKVPIIAANMDSVVGDYRMCVAMARAGGVAILHRFMSIEDMTQQIRRVKRAESPVITRPHTIEPDASIAEAVALMKEHSISGLPVLDAQDVPVGILTRRDLAAADSPIRRVHELMTPQDRLITAQGGAGQEEAKQLMVQGRVEKLILVDDAGQLAGMITMRDINNLSHFPLATKDSQGRLVVGAAVGVRGDYLDRARACEEAGADFLCLDIAHGHAEHAIEAVKALKEAVGIEIMAGNVATYEGAKDLIDAGADAIKVGVGPGSVCTTRLVAGVGVPQLTAVMECARACAEAGIPMCADGGIRRPADMAKGIAAGAETIMIGNLLAGTDESPGELLKRNGRMLKVHRGMASAGAARARKQLEIDKGTEEPTVEQQITLDSSEGASGGIFGQTTPEGVEATVAYSGPAANVLGELVGGLRSAMSYSDSASLEEYHSKARFVRITNAGLIESHPHDVDM